MNDSAIVLDGLVKYYDGRRVLNGIDLRIPKGCIYGLLGRNGAGKTTLIRILLGLEHATRGNTQILAVDSERLTAADRGKIGYVAEGHHLIQQYKVDYLVSLCKGLARQWDQVFFDRLIDLFRLPMNRKIKELSTGMRAQLNLALAMAIQPEVLILDDPTLGLDTVVRRQFLELAIDLIQKDGRTILFSSHILSDVERIADRIGIITGGKLVVDCELEQLKKRIRKWRLIFNNAPPKDFPLRDIIKIEHHDREMILTVADWDDRKHILLEALGANEIIEIPMSLEDLFIECTNPPGHTVFDDINTDREAAEC